MQGAVAYIVDTMHAINNEEKLTTLLVNVIYRGYYTYN